MYRLSVTTCMTYRFFRNETELIRTQMDVMWIYTPTTGVWYTTPRLNFGLVIIKADPLCARMLSKSWDRYQLVPANRRKNVAIDQNIFGSIVGWASPRYTRVYLNHVVAICIYSI